MPDWTAIKKEYITGDIALRPLAAKHGVSFNTLKDHVRREGWGEKRREYRKETGFAGRATPHHTTNYNVVEYIPPDIPDGASKLYAATEAILERVLELMPRSKSLYELRAAAAALRDVKEIRQIRTPLDEEEQIARIAKLKAETAEQEKEKQAPVEITFVGGTEEAAT